MELFYVFYCLFYRSKIVRIEKMAKNFSRKTGILFSFLTNEIPFHRITNLLFHKTFFNCKLWNVNCRLWNISCKL